VDALLQEYRRLAPLGVAVALRGEGGSCPGRLAHLGKEELRVGDVEQLLREYHALQRIAGEGAGSKG